MKIRELYPDAVSYTHQMCIRDRIHINIITFILLNTQIMLRDFIGRVIVDVHQPVSYTHLGILNEVFEVMLSFTPASI